MKLMLRMTCGVGLFLFVLVSHAEEMIVFTANQGWFSRIYSMNMDGSVIIFHEYEYYVFSDLEVVDNEDQAIIVSNRIGEFDYETAIPDR